MPVIKEAIAAGQYEYPKGLFFGGTKPSESTQLIRDHLASWIGEVDRIVHLDLHTGLGRFADYRLLLENDTPTQQRLWLESTFGKEWVERPRADGTSYQARGTIGQSLARQMAGRTYRFATVEFGTHGPIRVLAALRAENRVHHYARDPGKFAWVASELRECFCPRSPRWRRAVIEKSLALLERGQQGLSRDVDPDRAGRG